MVFARADDGASAICGTVRKDGNARDQRGHCEDNDR